MVWMENVVLLAYLVSVFPDLLVFKENQDH